MLSQSNVSLVLRPLQLFIACSIEKLGGGLETLQSDTAFSLNSVT